MAYTRCLTCGGCKHLRNSSFILRECPNCKGTGKIEKPEIDEIALLEEAREQKSLKKTKSYKAAKEEIKERLQVDDAQAEEFLDDELSKGEEK